jgi:choline dehydrogenase-like flavoprotein
MPATAMEVKVKREVIVAAGTMHTPQVLERSGIGDKKILEAAGVEVKVDLPGVGWNLQEHMHYDMSWRRERPTASGTIRV